MYAGSALESCVETAITERPKNQVPALGQKRGYHLWSDMCDGRCLLLGLIRKWSKFQFSARHQITVPVSTQGLYGYAEVKYHYAE